MKIYSILFDTVPQHPKIEEAFRSKGLHYGDLITNSFTAATLLSLFSGRTPSEMRKGGIGMSHTYARLPRKDQVEWNKNIIFNNLPEDWNIHIHAMPPSRGDNDPTVWPMYRGHDDFRIVPEAICGRDRDFIFYNYIKNEDETTFIHKMQNLSHDQNHFIFLKYNHYHDQGRGEQDQTLDLFVDIINSIDFSEENSLFWIFADHGESGGVTEMMPPPMSWLSWVSVTDNISNQQVIKDKIYMIDFYNTVMNRVYGRNSVPPRRAKAEDVLQSENLNRIYVVEDGRSKIDEYNCTTVSAIKYLDNNKFIQLSHHSPRGPNGDHTNDRMEVSIYDRRHTEDEIHDFSCSRQNIKFIEKNVELLEYLKSGPWNWYFE
jgi:hypothetical protein